MSLTSSEINFLSRTYIQASELGLALMLIFHSISKSTDFLLGPQVRMDDSVFSRAVQTNR